MNTHGKTDPGDPGDVVENGIGEKLYRLLKRYGVEKSKNVITDVRKSILNNSPDEGQCPKIEIEDTALEVMYRDYVASRKGPVLTFIEYKSLAKVITALSAD